MLRIPDLTPENLLSGKFTNELPELYALKNIIEHNGGHIHDPVFNHCVRTAQKLSDLLPTVQPKTKEWLAQKIGNYTRADLLYLAALLHDIGKQNMTPTVEGAFIGHEQAGADLVKDITLPKTDIAPAGRTHIVEIVSNHGLLHEASNDQIHSKEKVQKILQQHFSCSLELLLLVLADLTASDLVSINPSVYNFKVQFFTELLQSEQYQKYEPAY